MILTPICLVCKDGNEGSPGGDRTGPAGATGSRPAKAGEPQLQPEALAKLDAEGGAARDVLQLPNE